MCGSWLLSIWLSPSQNRAGCCGLSLAASACTRASFGCCCFLLRDASSHAARMHVLRGSVWRFLLGPGVYVQVVRLLAVVPARCTRAPRHQPRSRQPWQMSGSCLPLFFAVACRFFTEDAFRQQSSCSEMIGFPLTSTARAARGAGIGRRHGGAETWCCV